MGRRNQPVQTFSGKDGKHHMTSADYYRHQIGRQESKKLLKHETKQRKRKESEQVQKSGAFGYFGAVLAVLLLGLSALYLAMYFIAQSNDGKKLIPEMPFLQPVVEYIEKLYQVWAKPYLPF